jgi:hypothetical protein
MAVTDTTLRQQHARFAVVLQLLPPISMTDQSSGGRGRSEAAGGCRGGLARLRKPFELEEFHPAVAALLPQSPRADDRVA